MKLALKIFFFLLAMVVQNPASSDTISNPSSSSSGTSLNPDIQAATTSVSEEKGYPKGFPGIALTAKYMDHRITTGCKLIIAPIALFLHCSILYIFFFSDKRKKYTNTFYLLVFGGSTTDIFYCFWLLYQSICDLMGYCLFGHYFNLFISTMSQPVFFFCMNMDLLISINRFSAVVFFFKHNRLFSRNMILFYMLICLVYSLAESIPTFMYQKYYVSWEKS
jgi:hypothetical protein